MKNVVGQLIFLFFKIKVPLVEIILADLSGCINEPCNETANLCSQVQRMKILGFNAEISLLNAD